MNKKRLIGHAKGLGWGDVEQQNAPLHASNHPNADVPRNKYGIPLDLLAEFERENSQKKSNPAITRV